MGRMTEGRGGGRDKHKKARRIAPAGLLSFQLSLSQSRRPLAWASMV